MKYAPPGKMRMCTQLVIWQEKQPLPRSRGRERLTTLKAVMSYQNIRLFVQDLEYTELWFLRTHASVLGPFCTKWIETWFKSRGARGDIKTKTKCHPRCSLGVEESKGYSTKGGC